MLRSAKPCIVAQFLAVLQEEEIFYFLSANHSAKCNSLSEALYSIPKNYPSSEEGFCLRNFLPCLIAQIRARCCEEANYSTTKSCRPAKRRFFFKLTIQQGSLAKNTANQAPQSDETGSQPTQKRGKQKSPRNKISRAFYLAETESAGIEFLKVSSHLLSLR